MPRAHLVRTKAKLAVLRDQARELAARRSIFAMRILDEIASDDSAAPKDRVKAAEILLSYGLGKPVAMVVNVDAPAEVERTEEFRSMVRSILDEAKIIDTTLTEKGDEEEPPSTQSLKRHPLLPSNCSEGDPLSSPFVPTSSPVPQTILRPLSITCGMPPSLAAEDT